MPRTDYSSSEPPPRQLYNYTFDVLDVLHGWQSSETEDPNDKSLLYYGIELEVQPHPHLIGRSPIPQGMAVERMYSELEGFALAKNDSSIGHNGFEIVTVPATKLEHEKRWEPWFRSNTNMTRSWPTLTCGMHIHIGREKLRPLVLGKLLMFFNALHNRTFFFKVSGRTQLQLDKWSKFQDKVQLTQGLDTQPSYTRSISTNITKKGTLEIRIFRGNVRPEGFRKNLELVDACIHFCRTTSARHLTYEKFCDWFSDQKHSADYPHLIDWAKAHGYIRTVTKIKQHLMRTYGTGD